MPIKLFDSFSNLKDVMGSYVQDSTDTADKLNQIRQANDTKRAVGMHIQKLSALRDTFSKKYEDVDNAYNTKIGALTAHRDTLLENKPEAPDNNFVSQLGALNATISSTNSEYATQLNGMNREETSAMQSEAAQMAQLDPNIVKTLSETGIFKPHDIKIPSVEKVGTPKTEKPENGFLRYTTLPNGAKAVVYGRPKTDSSPEVISKIEPLTDKQNSDKEKADEIEKRAKIKKMQDLSEKAQKLGRTIDDINKGIAVHPLDKKAYISAYKNPFTDGNPTPPDKLQENPTGVAYRETVQNELDDTQKEINQLQAELGYNVTTPNNRTTVKPKVAQTPAKKEETSDKTERAKVFLEKEGYDTSDESLSTFLKNNPDF